MLKINEKIKHVTPNTANAK